MLKKLTLAIASVAAVVATAPTAMAAGTGYSPLATLPPGIPGGFTQVFTATTVPPKGTVVTGDLNHINHLIPKAHLELQVPPLAAPLGEQAVVTLANTSNIKPSLYKYVPKFVKDWKPVFALAVLLQHNGKGVRDNGYVTIRLTASQFKFGYIVEWSPKLHAFIPAPKFHARVLDGQVVVRFRSSTEFAVLEPPVSTK
jgi:hypothetical protein